MNETQRNRLGMLASFFLPVFMLGFYFYIQKIAPFGDSSFLIHDMNAQYVDFFSYMRTILNGSNNAVYSLSRGLGGDFGSFFAYYLVCPANLIPVLLPDTIMPAAITLEMLLLFGLSGLSCYHSLQYFSGSERMLFRIFLSLAYSMSGWMLLNAENFQFIQEAAILPMAAISIDRAKHGDKIWKAALWLALSIALNFYIGYMVCLFAGLWMLLPDGEKYYWKAFLIFPVAAVLSSPVWIPVLRQIGSTVKSMDPEWYRPTFNCSLPELLRKFLPGQFDSAQYRDNGLPAVFCSLTAVVGSIIFFFNEKNSCKKKHRLILFFILFVSLLFRPMTMVWQGFSQPHWWPYRFSFLMIFMIIILAGESQLKIPSSLLILGIVSLVFNLHCTFSVKLSHAVSSSDYVNDITEKKELLSMIDFDTDVFRIEDLSPRTDNDAMHFGYMGITHFDSLANQSIFEFLKRIGFPQDRYTLQYGCGNTAFANALLGVRYIIDKGSIRSSSVQSGIVFHLPDNTEKDAILTDSDPAAVQNQIARQFGASAPLMEMIEPDEPEFDNFECDDLFCWSEDPFSPGKITYKIIPDYDGFLYAIFNVKPEIGSFSVSDGVHSNSSKSGDYFYPLGKVSEGIPFSAVVISDESMADVPQIKFILENEQILTDVITPLIKDVKAERISSSHLRFHVPLSENTEDYLITVPYDKRWKATAEGKQLEISPFMDTFLTVSVPPETDGFEITYH